MFSVCKVAVDISHHLLTKVARVLHFLYCGFIFLATTEHKCPTTLFFVTYYWKIITFLQQKRRLQSLKDAVAWVSFMDEIFYPPPTILPAQVLVVMFLAVI